MLAYLVLLQVFSYQIQPLAVVLISIVIVLTHTPYNWGDAVLDRLFLPRWAVGYRDQLVFMRQQPLTARDPADSLAAAERTFDAVLQATRTKGLEDLIRREIEQIFKYTNFNNVEMLAESQLFELQIAQTALQDYAQSHSLAPDDLSDRQRADCLRCLLRSAIDEWSWSTANPSHRTRIERFILRKKYVEHRSRVDVERLLSDQFDEVITGGRYSRHLKQARTHLTHVLHERELAYVAHL